MTSVRTITVVALLAVVLTVGGCKSKAAAPATGGGKRGMKQPSFAVETLRVDARPHDLFITAPGVVDAFERVQITARVSGVVDKVTFAEGQEVKRGQGLAIIDSRRYALSVSAARAALAKAEATAADNGQSLKRRQNASESNPGLIPGEEIETYATRLRTAQADVAQAGESLKLAQLNLDDSLVKAPTDGVIQTRSVQTGQFVQAGTVMATLLQREPMLLRFNVTTAEAPRLKVGTDVNFTLKESQQTYSAKIALIAGAADAESRLVPITAHIDADRKFWLRPGSFARVEINVPSKRDFPMIPQSAARPSDRGFLAFIVEGDMAHERVLQLGMHTSDGWVEVKDGIQTGEQLVVRGVEALAEGTKVQVVPAAPTASASAAASGAASAGRPPKVSSGDDPSTSSAAPRASGDGPPRRRRDPSQAAPTGNAEKPSSAAPAEAP